MVQLSIPWTSLSSYATFYKMDSDTAEDFFFLLRKMDDAYLDHVRKKSESN